MIFKKPISKAPHGLQRFMFYLQIYDFKIQFIPGKQVIAADALSRSALPDSTAELTNAELESHIHLIKECLSVCFYINNGMLLWYIKVCFYISNGQPTTRWQVMTEAKPFFNISNELAVVNGIIFKGSQVVIPKSMQQSIKSKLHEGHLGIVLTQLRARNCVYWINIDSEIVDIISSYPSCIQYQHKQQNETLIQHDIRKHILILLGLFRVVSGI